MTILFFMRSTVYVRNFESTLRLLADRGHRVHVVANPHLPESDALIARLCGAHAGITHGPAPAVPFTAWSLLGRELRRAVDYLRYLEPAYAGAPKLRLRAERGAPGFVTAALRWPLIDSRPGRWLLSRALRWSDRAVPRNPAIDAFVAEHNPDLVLVTPLVEPGSPQAEYLRSARAAGVPTGLCVYSWDNLTNKGLIHDPLDVVTVWNEVMKREAVTLHRVPANRVIVTGAAGYDHWFGWRPRYTREEFCHRVSLPADRPYLLYLCSSRFIAPHEVDFIRRWIAEVRAASPILRDASVLVRPHPQNTDQWEAADLGAERVAIWPRAGANPMDEESRSDYYDSIHHCAAVVGVNTSAQIESAIVGRGVYTVLAPEFRDTQEGTLHFHHLAGGIQVARDMAEHVAQLEAALHGNTDADRSRRFVESFVRPGGWDVPATPRRVAAGEDTAARGRRRPDPGAWWGRLVRPLLGRAAVRLARSDKAQRQKEARQKKVKQERDRERARRRAAAHADRQRARAERDRQRQEAVERRQAAQHAREAFEARAWEHYVTVRAWSARLRDQADLPPVPLTESEQQVVSALSPLWDAASSTIAALRRLAAPVSGVRVADYDSRGGPLAPRLKRTIGFLRKMVGSDLLVYEPPALGGFGFNEQGALYNEDTARFFCVLVALQDAGVLPAFRGNRSRRLVWEIGGGWGGFAYQFKRVCPNVTYVISGSPDLFLLSAPYLMSLFPEANCRFYDPKAPDSLWDDWERIDFLFVPEGALDQLHPPPVDLTLDVMALRTMGPRRACLHARRAFEFGSRFFYTAAPSGATQPTDVEQAMARFYWTHPVPPRRDPKLAAADPDAQPELDHLVGWRRLRV